MLRRLTQLCMVLGIAAMLFACLHTGNAPAHAQAYYPGAQYSAYSNSNFPAQSFTAAGTFRQTIGAVGLAKVTISGTWTNDNLQIFADDAATPLAMLPAAGKLSPIVTLTANGVYYVNLAGNTSYTLSDACPSACTGTMVVKVTANPLDVGFRLGPLSANPCADPAIKLSVASVSITTATTTKVISGPGSGASTQLYPCGGEMTVGASTTVQFATGYQTTNPCDTGTGSGGIAGALTPATGGIVNPPTGVGAGNGNDYCIISTGSGGIKGFIVYAPAQ